MTFFWLMLLMPVFFMVVFIVQKAHLMMSLLSLEGIALSLIMMICLLSSMNFNSMYSFILILLTFGACEASIGLSIMVLMSRKFGTDLVKYIVLNSC